MGICKRIAALVAAVCLILPTAGCWDSVELNRRAIVSGVAVDRGPAPEQAYVLTFQVIVADEISGKNTRGNPPVVLYTGTGRSMFEALSNASRKVSRFLSLAHIRVIVISEEWARNGINNILDVLERDNESRLTTNIFVSKKQSAKDILSVLTVFGRIPSMDLVGKLETTSRTFGYNFIKEVDDVVRDIQIAGGGGLINGVHVTGALEEGQSLDNLKRVNPHAILNLSGLAAFKGDRLIAWLDGSEARGSALLLNKVKQTPAFVRSPEYGMISFDIYNNKVKLETTSTESGHPAFTVRILQQASIKEIANGPDLTNPNTLVKIEKLVEQFTQNQVASAVSRAKELKSDYLGFGAAYERSNPKGWKKIKGSWDTVFSGCEVKIKIDAVIRHTDMRTNSIH
ncbi:Ger(x)C family spore germination protein [Paenibacillus sp. HN-1]|uniref:Ger(x)C family spore germination protein n=1 Tax=Paenibacillus TaxID=44249 RepID=UPI001CAA3E96|nr:MULTISPECIES: Ger(x)C family spore germination protein [Paenibacillus]MBY9082294.1 Ger(x)C family spore germination protein [Paenibacillus sp. CGMCC 1.18879]MBY9086342.1 Ger(x)C family spore germination protein [Paenibacillus sinensis]